MENMADDPAHRPRRRVLLLGATGTIGQATARALVRDGHELVALVRPSPVECVIEGADVRACDVTSEAALARDGFRGERFDVLVSCLASRSGLPADAWAIDHDAHVLALDAALRAGVRQVVLLSAICLQKPRLAFQRAKLAFEARLIESGVAYSIVRPTAYFKSLCGQVERVRRGKPFVVFGDGTLTACKPISDDDLGTYLSACIDDASRRNRILPIGGPGPAITPREQGEHLFRVLGRTPRFRHVPVGLLSWIAGVLGVVGRVAPAMAAKSELARIGHYYATESMLVWNESRGCYDEAATPSTGADTLFDCYDRILAGEIEAPGLRDHAVF